MSTASLNYETRMECYCGYNVSMQRGWTVQNPGRRFVACPDYDAHSNTRSCNFFRWVDKEMTDWQKEVILHLMDERTKMHWEVDALKRKLELANKKLRKITTDRVMMKMLYPQRVWRFGLVVNTTLGGMVVSWIASYFM
jgi:GRF zinc finger protein